MEIKDLQHLKISEDVCQFLIDISILEYRDDKIYLCHRYELQNLPSKQTNPLSLEAFYKTPLVGRADPNSVNEFGGTSVYALYKVPQKAFETSKLTTKHSQFFTVNKVIHKAAGRICAIYFCSRQTYARNTKFEYFSFSELDVFNIHCNCGKINTIKIDALKYHMRNHNVYECKSCQTRGDRNPFYGKQHTEASKEKQVTSYGDRTGIKNPFYGKHHSEENKSLFKITSSRPGKTNPFYGKKHSLATKKRLSEIGIERAKDPQVREQLKLNAIKNLENRSFRMTKPERLTKKWLELQDVNFHYNFILNKKFQYDFRLPEKKVLIEVNGDYWHGNPEIYAPNELNKTQRFKIQRDIEKKKYAEKHGYQVLYIWEKDIKENNFTAIKGLLI